MLSLSTGALLSLAVLLPLGLLGEPTWAARDLLLATLLQDLPILVVVLLLAPRALPATLADLGLRPTSRPAIRRGLAAGAFAFAVSVPLAVLQQLLFGSPPQEIVVAFQSHRGWLDYLLDVAAGVAVAPFAEELLFRGVLFAGLRQRLGFWPAAVVSSLVFVAPHGLSATLPIFAVGMVLARLYERERNLYVAFAAHAFFNFIGLTLAFLAGGAA